MRLAAWLIAISAVFALALLGRSVLIPPTAVSDRSTAVLERREGTGPEQPGGKPEADVAQGRQTGFASRLGLAFRRWREATPDFEELLEENREAGMRAVATALASDDAESRLRAVEAVGGLEGPGVLALLNTALADPDQEVRQSALEALTAYEGPEAVPLLALAIHDSDPQLRIQALEALADHGDEGLRPIKGALSDPDEEVRATARDLLDLPPEDE